MSLFKDFNSNTDNEQTWLTPPDLVKSLGVFDLDPCTPVNRLWDTASNHYNKIDDGLSKKWQGRVWLNPPYGDQLKLWLNKMKNHMNGIALTFARTETISFQKYVFPFAYSILFVHGRIKFYNKKGLIQGTSNAPSVLIAYTEADAEAIEQSEHKYAQGHHLYLQCGSIYLIEQNKTWKVVVHEALVDLNGQATLQEMYTLVYASAPKKARRNVHYKAKIRQVLQANFSRIGKGKYSIR